MIFELGNSENKIQTCGSPKGNFYLLCCCEESSVGRLAVGIWGQQREGGFLLGKRWDWKERGSKKPFMTLVTDVHKSENLHDWGLEKCWYDVLLCLPILPNVYYVSVILNNSITLSSILNRLLQGRVHWSL